MNCFVLKWLSFLISELFPMPSNLSKHAVTNCSSLLAVFCLSQKISPEHVFGDFSLCGTAYLNCSMTSAAASLPAHLLAPITHSWTNPTAAQLVVTFQPLTVVTSWSLTVSGTTAMSGAWCPTHPEDLGRRSQGTLHPCTTLLCQMQQAETFLMAKHLLRLHSCK